MLERGTEAFGYYGKLPGWGDFISHSLTATVIDPLDHWLQGMIMASRADLGRRWEDAYYTAPLWRFALPAGLCGSAPFAGVLMPSVDRVGRQFPFCIGATVAAPDAASAHRAMAPLWPTLEDTALAMLDDGATRDWLDGRIDALSAPSTPAPLVTRRRAKAVLAISDHGAIGDALSADWVAAAGYADPAVWSCLWQGGERLMVCDGWPSDADAATLLDLEGEGWGTAAPMLLSEEAL
ncbi:MAG: type VI secretion system-associated protein TagF [Pseudomonadota bacterium]